MHRYVFLAIAFTTTVSAQTPHQKLARDIFRELIEINTTHTFGTTKAVEILTSRLKSAGFTDGDIQISSLVPEKRNLVVRLRGRGNEKPILFLAHLDVVEAKPEDWSPDIDPFKFTERDGYFYGRGTVDVKDEAAILIATLIRLKQEKFIPSRDVMVALTADEEAGGNANGALWLVQNRAGMIDPAYVINTDAGGGQMEKGKRLRYTVQTSEKAYITYQLEVKNPGGHSSQPTRDNAIYRLAEGLARLGKYDFPVRLNDATRLFFERMTGAVPNDDAAIKRLAENSFFNSVMRTTCVATMLQAGHAENALPQTARAIVNCRVLPDDSQANVTATLNDVLADKEISVTATNELRLTPASPLKPEVLQPLEKIVANMWPGVPVVPVMDPWATDGVFFRALGIPVYGAPAVFYDIDPLRAHGKDERVGVQPFYEGIEFMYRLMKALTSR